ncbi:hypothetical protein BOTBODRAFT_183766 [Botryobasidium botryosum FD-172 SS1]|uniref:F-box domain-containing protein n=1 Tax=Botryobasidium botryosum (strain FD-172 SS1) TaxID=930990 RepID=A0A067N2D0_BOTB1|nr:hypothetical protein BOTBODRAFT_183766 [Botryobasidium botryosum FD-172 SS1]
MMDAKLAISVPRLIEELCTQIRPRDNHNQQDLNNCMETERPNASLGLAHNAPTDECEIATAARDIAIAAITSHVAHMVSSIRGCHNQRQPIYRLPNELLVMIFELAVCSDQSAFQPLDMKAPINISRVSRHWRECASSAHTLWRRIDSMNLHIAHVFLSRSGCIPLDIELTNMYLWYNEHFVDTKSYQIANGYFKNPATFFQPLLPHVHRWRSLIIPRVEIGDLHKILRSPAPNLKALCVRSLGAWSGELSRVSDLFGGDPPCLDVLELTRVPLPLSSPMFTGLIRLQLESIIFTHSTARQLLHNISKCPLLEVLGLTAICLPALARADLDFMASLEVVRLPRLRVTRLDELDCTVIRSILSFLSTPSIQSISVASDGSMTLPSILPSKSHLPEIFPSLPHIRRLNFLFYPVGGVHARKLRIRTSQPPEVLYVFGQSDTDQDILSLMLSIGLDLPLVNLEALSIDISGVDANAFAAYATMLSNFSTITSLELKNCSIYAVQALVVTDTSHLCPLLQVLVLKRTAADDACLIALAKSRAVGGECPVHLRRIEIKECEQVTAFAAKELAGLSVAAEWDGGSDKTPQ